MSAEEQEAFDKARKAVREEKEAEFAKLKKAAGYDDDNCDLECKAAYEEDLLAWRKNVFETCKTDEKSIQCVKAFELREDEEQARAGGDKNYYHGMTPEEKSSFTENRQEAIKAVEASISAAFIKASKPAKGQSGSDCDVAAVTEGGKASCSNKEANHCCGTAKPKEGAFVNESIEICMPAPTAAGGVGGALNAAVGVAPTSDYENVVGDKYTFTCYEGAYRIASTVAATVAAAYTLM